ncbi:CheW protein [Solidesulfovibrio fructosivorans JJ]]|uniref:CheW protein n=1 Tax=Solidesulfovibrio fructosivorans JJ] TaxID=596151 RepID=E1JSW1_SOLFR|nr:chemotaxis protein CheW [Solidesulfovibrio fructosivorans]EFL52594.1 CheW protein [Solidesulfovibrio fructosivorans JJ]]
MADDVPRQYLTFRLGNECFALESLVVSEVLDVPAITWVPLSPDYLRGVVNLRGNAATVVDLRRKLELGEADEGETSCLVIVERDFDGETLPVAALADDVHEVVEIAPADIAPPPDMGLPVPPRFVKGLAMVDGGFVMVLDPDRLFSLEEVSARRR